MQLTLTYLETGAEKRALHGLTFKSTWNQSQKSLNPL